MKMRVIGAGLGRTGTHSLKLALEALLGAPCHHMVEVFEHPEQVAPFRAAAHGEMPDWHALLARYAAAIDWPVCSFWPELMAAYPDALVLLSVRRDAESWWKSASETIFRAMQGKPGEPPTMAAEVVRARFCDDVTDKAAAIAAYERHNAAVRAGVPASRLLEWTPGDGWEPLCAALSLPVPAAPFPHVNTTAEFQAMMQSREAAAPAREG